MRGTLTTDEVEEAEALWLEGATFPDIARGLGLPRWDVYLALESRRLRPWCAVRSERGARHELARRREAAEGQEMLELMLAVASVEG